MGSYLEASDGYRAFRKAFHSFQQRKYTKSLREIDSFLSCQINQSESSKEIQLISKLAKESLDQMQYFIDWILKHKTSAHFINIVIVMSILKQNYISLRKIAKRNKISKKISDICFKKGVQLLAINNYSTAFLYFMKTLQEEDANNFQRCIYQIDRCFSSMQNLGQSFQRLLNLSLERPGSKQIGLLLVDIYVKYYNNDGDQLSQLLGIRQQRLVEYSTNHHQILNHLVQKKAESQRHSQILIFERQSVLLKEKEASVDQRALVQIKQERQFEEQHRSNVEQQKSLTEFIPSAMKESEIQLDSALKSIDSLIVRSLYAEAIGKCQSILKQHPLNKQIMQKIEKCLHALRKMSSKADSQSSKNKSKVISVFSEPLENSRDQEFTLRKRGLSIVY